MDGPIDDVFPQLDLSPALTLLSRADHLLMVSGAFELWWSTC